MSKQEEEAKKILENYAKTVCLIDRTIGAPQDMKHIEEYSLENSIKAIMDLIGEGYGSGYIDGQEQTWKRCGKDHGI